MFTGIIEAIGDVRGLRRSGPGGRLGVRAPTLAAGARLGDSIAVDGACLTVATLEGATFWADVSAETLARTTLGGLRPGDAVNLERPLRLGDRLGGHLVTGHVDAIGKVVRVVSRPPGTRAAVSFPSDGRPFLVSKGSVAVNGVSLTVAALGPSFFEVELIPATLETTNLGLLRAGAAVNLEYDIIGKYVYNNMLGRSREGGS